MTCEEAFAVLGLPPTASDAEIRETHYRLVTKLHPDHGGSDYLAANITQARDVLLGP
jgi:curved DNA-binding protein CbpA